MTIEELQADYQRKRIKLEEEEDLLQYFNRKGEEVVEQSEQLLRRSLNGLALDNEPLMRARKQYQIAEEQYKAALNSERRQLHQRFDDLEREYQAAYRKFNQ